MYFNKVNIPLNGVKNLKMWVLGQSVLFFFFLTRIFLASFLKFICWEPAFHIFCVKSLRNLGCLISGNVGCLFWDNAKILFSFSTLEHLLDIFKFWPKDQKKKKKRIYSNSASLLDANVISTSKNVNGWMFGAMIAPLYPGHNQFPKLSSSKAKKFKSLHFAI